VPEEDLRSDSVGSKIEPTSEIGKAPEPSAHVLQPVASRGEAPAKVAHPVSGGSGGLAEAKLLSVSEIARLKGYEGDACGDCGQFTMVRNGTCLKCITCGTTTGCS
jgi:ribonucleoside-diphosphate reductase alpha chain